MSASHVFFGYSVPMAELQCCVCGTCFAMPKIMNDNLRKTQASFYCPNGHAQSYSQSEADRLRKELASEKNKLVEANRLRWEAEAQKTKLERKLKRVKRGVCPCCKRSFENLHRHMSGEHPEFLSEAASA